MKDRPLQCLTILAGEGRHTGPVQIFWKTTAVCLTDLEQVHSGTSRLFSLAEKIVSLNEKKDITVFFFLENFSPKL